MAATTVRIDVESEIEWWRPLVQWFLCLPHLLYTVVLATAAGIAAFFIGVAVLVTGRVPKSLGRFVVFSLRERVRTYSYFFVLRRSCPPYATTISEVDPGDDEQVEVSIVVPDTLPRWAILRGLLVLPHVLVLAPVGVAMDLCYPVWMLLASAGRGWPPGVERLLVSVERWVAAVVSYTLLVSDEAPAFGLGAYDVDAPSPARAR